MSALVFGSSANMFVLWDEEDREPRVQFLSEAGLFLQEIFCSNLFVS
jgi:hypothetical protein